MSLMDSFKNMTGMNGGGDKDKSAGVFGAIQSVIQQQGGLGGLVEKFKQSGMGDTVNSWIGLGKNQDVSGSQLEKILGSEQVKAIAEKLGIDPKAAAEQVAGMLPKIVDKLTPTGDVPPEGMVNQALEMLKGKV